MNNKRETPNFATWQQDTLAKFAHEVYIRLQDEQAANEQLRLDLKDAMKLAHKQILEDNQA
jgi:ribosomal protein S20